jgi:hypothetical protein
MAASRSVDVLDFLQKSRQIFHVIGRQSQASLLLGEVCMFTFVELFVEGKTFGRLVQTLNGGFLLNFIQQQIHILETAFEVLDHLFSASMPAGSNNQFGLLKLQGYESDDWLFDLQLPWSRAMANRPKFRGCVHLMQICVRQ